MAASPAEIDAATAEPPPHFFRPPVADRRRV
jgi:hypothetical protein